MATAEAWWVIASTSIGAAPAYSYFFGTQAGAETAAKRVVEVTATQAVTGPFASKAAAEAAVKSKQVNTPSPTSLTTTLPGIGSNKPVTDTGDQSTQGFLAGITGFSGTDFVIRAAKVIIGGVLLIIGLAHITGAGNAVASAARRIPVPV